MMMKRTELYLIPLNAHLDTVMSNEQSDSVAVIHCLLKAVQQVSCLQEKKKKEQRNMHHFAWQLHPVS